MEAKEPRCAAVPSGARCRQPCLADGWCRRPAEPLHVCADDTDPVAASWSAQGLASSMARLRRRGGPDGLLWQRPCPRARKASSVPGHPCPVYRSHPCGTQPEREGLAEGQRPPCRGQAAHAGTVPTYRRRRREHPRTGRGAVATCRAVSLQAVDHAERPTTRWPMAAARGVRGPCCRHSLCVPASPCGQCTRRCATPEKERMPPMFASQQPSRGRAIQPPGTAAVAAGVRRGEAGLRGVPATRRVWPWARKAITLILSDRYGAPMAGAGDLWECCPGPVRLVGFQTGERWKEHCGDHRPKRRHRSL
jgi:hypothetical protein